MVRERLARGRAGEAHVEKDVLEERTWLEKHTLSSSARGLRSRRGLRGTRCREAPVHERREEREAREARGSQAVGRRATGKSRLLSCVLFIWVYVQMLVGGACGGYRRIV